MQPHNIKISSIPFLFTHCNQFPPVQKELRHRWQLTFYEQYVGTVREFYTKLPPDRFPTITKHLGDMMGGDSDERFAFGLDMMIRSLETYVPDSA